MLDGQEVTSKERKDADQRFAQGQCRKFNFGMLLDYLILINIVLLADELILILTQLCYQFSLKFYSAVGFPSLCKILFLNCVCFRFLS